jgi:hypothetical protein
VQLPPWTGIEYRILNSIARHDPQYRSGTQERFVVHVSGYLQITGARQAELVPSSPRFSKAKLTSTADGLESDQQWQNAKRLSVHMFFEFLSRLDRRNKGCNITDVEVVKSAKV